jgi:hypothetical protein
MLPLILTILLSGSATSEGTHSATEYYAVRAGSAWTYLAGKDKVVMQVSGVENWKADLQLAWGKRSTGGTWRVKEGAWVEHLSIRGPGESVLLPAALQVGTRWVGPASLERGAKDSSQFEVVAIDATAEVPAGTYEKCLAVLETSAGGGVLTHFWAPNVGKVGVKSNDDWVLKLVKYEAGRRLNGD